jgi:hypothetical protein
MTRDGDDSGGLRHEFGRREDWARKQANSLLSITRVTVAVSPRCRRAFNGAALVTRAEAGERIVVTRSGRAVACLGPYPSVQLQSDHSGSA